MAGVRPTGGTHDGCPFRRLSAPVGGAFLAPPLPESFTRKNLHAKGGNVREKASLGKLVHPLKKTLNIMLRNIISL